MNNDILELLDDLENLIVVIDDENNNQEYWYTSISEWVNQQRSIYGGATGECAS